MRSLRDSALITLLTDPKNHYEDMFPKGHFYRILCNNFSTSYRRLYTAFDLIETNIPVDKIQLHPNGAIDLLDLMNKLKKKLSIQQFMILVIYTGVGVNAKAKNNIFFQKMSEEKRFKMFRMARKMAKQGDHFLMSALEILYDEKLDANSEKTRASVQKAIELDSFSTLKDFLKNLENATRESINALFADLPCKPSKKIGNLIRCFIESQQ
ncbi:hypothetical protein L596_000641 [Steinernema carpocapsae]|uniref:Uncharacterized protein n=1 Tax=Steinernema carpocapsae TaxID=34508 RepID=A0A4U8UJJ0_STECR|nr:hypothetical protein L596_000641 [Steinernema carpocapsae]